MTPRDFRSLLLERAGGATHLLSRSALDQLERYYRLLDRWNAKVNLTGIQLSALSDRGVDRLFVEPLLAAGHVSEGAGSWIDLGSGGGSPAIPLKIVCPGLRLTMVEVRARKAAFLREVVRSLELSEVVVENTTFAEMSGRAEMQCSIDLVTVRGVKLDERVFDAVAKLLRPGGRFLLFRSESMESVTDERFRVEYVVPLVDGAGSRSSLVVLTRTSR